MLHAFEVARHAQIRFVVQGPGDNTSDDMPYIQYYGRTYNQELIAGLVRVQQGNSRFPADFCSFWSI